MIHNVIFVANIVSIVALPHVCAYRLTEKLARSDMYWRERVLGSTL